MSQPYPLPRETRSTGQMAFNGSDQVYGPFDFKIFDIEDVAVYLKHDGEDTYALSAAAVVTKTSGLDYDTFSVDFGTVHPATSTYVVRGERVPERSIAVTKGGGINTAALEKDLTKLAVEDQELRRDVGKAIKVPPGSDNFPVATPEAGKVLGFNEAGNAFVWLSRGDAGFAVPGDGTVGADKIAAGAVTGAKIADGAVTEAKIADGAVTEAKIADDAVTAQKVEDGAITEAKIADQAVTRGKLADNIGTALIVDDVADVKEIALADVAAGDLVYWRGFDNGTDNCGGLGIVVSGVASSTLDGVVMNLTAGSFHVRRVDLGVGPIHTRWVGIKPNVSSSATFNPDSFAANNSSRWEDMNDFCEAQLLAWIASSTAAYVVTNGIYVDPGIHDFADTTQHTIGESVTVDGAGMLISVLRTNYSTSSNFLVCDGSASATYGAGTVVKNIGIRHFSLLTNATKYGLRFDSIVRGLHLENVAIYGFGRNLRTEDCWDIELTNVWSESAYEVCWSHFGNINSVSARGCRFDGPRSTTTMGCVFLYDNNNAGRAVKFDDCAFQRSEKIGLQLWGIRSVVITNCQFEGNNRQDDSSPDIWVQASGTYSASNTITLEVSHCYFTTTGRNGATSSRAINVRNDVGTGSIFLIHANVVADNTFGTFIDIDGNYAYELFWLNRNIYGSNSNSIPANVNER